MSAVTIYSKLCYWQTTGVCRTTRVNKPNKYQHVNVKCKDTIALNQTQDEEFVDQVFRLGHKSFHSGQAETETIWTMDKTNKGNHFPRRVELHFTNPRLFRSPILFEFHFVLRLVISEMETFKLELRQSSYRTIDSQTMFNF